jgi:hypothetical protein
MQHHLVCIACTEPYRNLHISNRVGDVIDNPIEQSVEVERGGNKIRGPLQLHEDLNEFARRTDARCDGVASLDGGGEGGHRCPL